MKIFLIFFLSFMMIPVFAPSHPEYVGFEAPLKQLANGIAPQKVICQDSLELIFKMTNGNPACVTQHTKVKLLERGWGTTTPLPWTPTKGPSASNEFSVLYTKEGGIAGIRQVISINSDEDIITIEERNEKIESLLLEPETAELLKLVEESEFFTIDQKNYPPQEGWADYFSYSLKITTENGDNEITWTDASEIIPDSAKTIAQQIESLGNQKQCEKTGGKWGIWSNASFVSSTCNPPTLDAGTECTDSSQCQSFCQAKDGAVIGTEDTGMCYGFELAICMQEVRNGVVDPEWCQ